MLMHRLAYLSVQHYSRRIGFVPFFYPQPLAFAITPHVVYPRNSHVILFSSSAAMSSDDRSSKKMSSSKKSNTTSPKKRKRNQQPSPPILDNSDDGDEGQQHEWFHTFTQNDPVYVDYMTNEWGYEKHTDEELFEKLCLGEYKNLIYIPLALCDNQYLTFSSMCFSFSLLM